jgi:hypothetical protein
MPEADGTTAHTAQADTASEQIAPARTASAHAGPAPAASSKPLSITKTAAEARKTGSARPSVDEATPHPRKAKATPPPQAVAASARHREMPTAAIHPTHGPYRIQIASFSTPKGAAAAYRRLLNRFPDVLGGLPLAIQAADLGSRGTWYRVQVGAFDWHGASSLCTALKAQGGDCLPVKPEA